MRVKLLPKAEKSYTRLPYNIQKKVQKVILIVSQNQESKSLKIKKLKRFKNRWEARIDYTYRLTYSIIEDTLIIMTMGMHDEGLGKK